MYLYYNFLSLFYFQELRNRNLGIASIRHFPMMYLL